MSRFGHKLILRVIILYTVKSCGGRPLKFWLLFSYYNIYYISWACACRPDTFGMKPSENNTRTRLLGSAESPSSSPQWSSRPPPNGYSYNTGGAGQSRYLPTTGANADRNGRHEGLFYDEYDSTSHALPDITQGNTYGDDGQSASDYPFLKAQPDANGFLRSTGSSRIPSASSSTYLRSQSRHSDETRAASLVVFGGIMAYSFVVCLENVIVFPSLWPRLLQYCGPKYSESQLQTYLGWTMGVFSLGRGVSALAINGRPPTRWNMRSAATLCFLFSACGCGLYVLADSPEALVASRALSGLGAGALTLMITSLTSFSSPESRTSAISRFFIAAALGEIAGPLVSYATTNVEFTLFQGLKINSLNSVGLWTLVLFMLSFVFVCRSIDASAHPEVEIEEPITLRLLPPRLILIFTLALFVNMGVSSWETVVTPLAQQHFQWGVGNNSLLFVMSGAVLFFSNIVLVRVATALRLSDELGTFISIVIATAGAVTLIVGSSNIAVFVVGNLLFTLGIFCPLTFVTSMYTKNIVARPSLFIGAFRAASAGIRVVGNILGAFSLPYSAPGKSTVATVCVGGGGNHSHHALSDTDGSAENASQVLNLISMGPDAGGLHTEASLLNTLGTAGRTQCLAVLPFQNAKNHMEKVSLSESGPEFLLLSICAAALVVTIMIWCMKPKYPLR